jgi:hypothetical protein
MRHGAGCSTGGSCQHSHPAASHAACGNAAARTTPLRRTLSSSSCCGSSEALLMSAMTTAAAVAGEAVPGCTQKSDCPPAAEMLLLAAVRGQTAVLTMRWVAGLHDSRFPPSRSCLVSHSDGSAAREQITCKSCGPAPIGSVDATDGSQAPLDVGDKAQPAVQAELGR